jgi:hypothetical protein
LLALLGLLLLLLLLLLLQLPLLLVPTRRVQKDASTEVERVVEMHGTCTAAPAGKHCEATGKCEHRDSEGGGNALAGNLSENTKIKGNDVQLRHLQQPFLLVKYARQQENANSEMEKNNGNARQFQLLLLLVLPVREGNTSTEIKKQW